MVILEQVERVLSYGEICDSCLGRLFGKRSHGLTNAERGSSLRISLMLEKDLPFVPPVKGCWVCGGVLGRVEEWAGKVAKALEGIEFTTFQIGTKVPPLLSENEEMLWSDLGLTQAEPLNAEMNREVGKRVEKMLGKRADMKRPEVVAILDLGHDRVEVQVNPVFIRGRYQKLERGIPQTRWFCRECGGAGCPRCHGTGKMYADSVEELIGRHVKEWFSAEDAVLHGGGREDIDARMLGNGRPFVMEVVAPRRRRVDLAALAMEINARESGRISVALDGYADRGEVRGVKSERAHKRYRVQLEVEGSLAPGEMEHAIALLQGASVRQRTPRRVSHRRADLVRERRVLGMELVSQVDRRFELEVTGESGLYIKELITGDEGRTNPSLASLLGRPCRVLHLDVIGVLSETSSEGRQ